MILGRSRQLKCLALKLLDPMLEHRAILLGEKPRQDAHIHAHGMNGDQVGIEGSVVDLAQSKTVGNDRISTLRGIWNDVGGLEQSKLAQLTHRTA